MSVKQLCLLGMVCLFFVAGNLQAQEQPVENASNVTELTVDEAVDYALKNSRTLKSAAIDLELKERAKKYCWNVVVPSVSASGVLSRANEYSNTISMIMPYINPSYVAPEVEESDHWSAVGSISANLNLSLALIQGIKATRANYEAGLITWNQTLKETEVNIRKMFYGILIQQESLKLQEQSLQNAKNRWEQAQINYKNGMVPELSLLQTQVTYENQKPSVLKLQQSLEQQLDTFAFLLGMPFGSKIKLNGTISPDFKELDANKLVAQYLNNRLDVQSMKKNLELMRISLAATNLQTFTPALVLSYGIQPVVYDLTEDWLEDSNNGDNGSFSATLAWNLTNMLPFSDNMQKRKDTKQNIAKLELTLQTVLQNAEMEIHTLVDKLDQSKAAIESAQRNIDLAKKAYEMTTLAYKNGTTELLDVRDSESQMNQAQLGLINENYTYLSSLLDLEYAINAKLN